MRVFETFKIIDAYDIDKLVRAEPCCVNKQIRIKKYRVTIEEIEESHDVYAERLQKVWDECGSDHNWKVLRNMAEELGIELQGDLGSKRIKKEQ